MPENQNKYSA